MLSQFLMTDSLRRKSEPYKNQFMSQHHVFGRNSTFKGLATSSSELRNSTQTARLRACEQQNYCNYKT